MKKLSEDEQDNKVLSYRHNDRRKNNPEVGMVSPDTDPDDPKTTYSYDPHIDPVLEFDSNRFQIESLIDDALASGDQAVMQNALEQLKRQQAPYMNWAGKAEKSSFNVDTVSLHVHERIDPASILSAVRKGWAKEKPNKTQVPSEQLGLFNAPFENLPLRDAIDFYKHDRGWANRLIAGDSLLVMNSLLQKESMAGQIQTVFFDPPYGIKYGSNFQPFIDKRDVKDGKDQDLTQEPEMLKAFRDTWELGIHSYLTYLRDRIKLAHELLNNTGSIVLQISDENLHRVRALLDEVFGADNFFSLITFKKTLPLGASGLPAISDYLVWYAKDIKQMKFRQLYQEKSVGAGTGYTWIQEDDFSRRKMTKEEREGVIEKNFRPFFLDKLTSSGYTPTCTFDFEFNGEVVKSQAKSWRTNTEGVQRLIKANRIMKPASVPNYVVYHDDFPVQTIHNLWDDTHGASDAIYVVQTSNKVLERIILMTSDPGDLIFDPTCGSGTTAHMSEKWGRRWISCDSSRVALTLAKQRLMTASYDYFELKYPHEGLKGGFIYATVPHVTLKSISNNPDIDSIYESHKGALEAAIAKVNNVCSTKYSLTNLPVEINIDSTDANQVKEIEGLTQVRISLQKAIDASIASHADQEQLFDKPAIDKKKMRITGPFTAEAVPSPMVQSLDDSNQPLEVDQSISRSGESQRQHDWRNELIKTGIRGKNGQMLKLVDLESLPDVKYIHATGTIVDSGERVVVSFGPEYSLLEQRQVEMAMREAGELFPRPKMILFCGFDFDPEAAKDIDSTKGIMALRVKMNADLLTDDLKKQRSSNQSFWLMGQPDVHLTKAKDGLWQVEVNGFDYFDTAKGELVSGGKGNIAAWMLDTDYDSRSLFPRQVFFPMAGSKDGWGKLKKEIRAELDEPALTKFSGTVSIPFNAGENKRIAVKIVDDRGIESLKVLDLED